MIFYFAHRTYIARGQRNPRRRWRVYEFKTSRGVIRLMRELLARRLVRNVIVYR